MDDSFTANDCGSEYRESDKRFEKQREDKPYSYLENVKLVSGEFKEKNSSEVPFEDVDAGTVIVYQALLLSLLVKEPSKGLSQYMMAEWDNEEEDRLLLPVKAYAFADRIGSKRIGKCIYSYVGQRLWNNRREDPFGCLSPDAIELAWKHLPEGDPLRATLVLGFVMAKYSRQGDMTCSLRSYPLDFIAAVALTFGVLIDEMSTGPGDWANDPVKGFEDGFLIDHRRGPAWGAIFRTLGEEMDDEGRNYPKQRPKLVKSQFDDHVYVHYLTSENAQTS
ncbi:MAG: hypothetical protein MMC23_008559 [Stictis urceolatum]|nr:hypothetical protein [Stictis urceolata]